MTDEIKPAVKTAFTEVWAKNSRDKWGMMNSFRSEQDAGNYVEDELLRSQPRLPVRIITVERTATVVREYNK